MKTYYQDIFLVTEDSKHVLLMQFSCELNIIAVIIELRVPKKHRMAFNNPTDSLDLMSLFNEWLTFFLPEKMSNVSSVRK